MANPKRDLTDKQIDQLREFSEQGLLKSEAAKRLKVTHGWLTKSAKRIGFIDEFERLFPHTRNVSFELTESALAELRRLSEIGYPKPAACRAIGCCDSTLNAAAKEKGVLDEIRALFPHGGNKILFDLVEEYSGIKHVSEAEIEGSLSVDTSLLHVRAAIMDWRRAA